MSEATLNQRWAATLVGTLVGSGVRHAVIAPGSRSTPLALAFADRSEVKIWSVMDERSAAFFALGQAKALDAPVAVVCTSGTAGAHFLPAAMEACEGGVPLIFLTADRPWELHGFGAPQTVDQVGLLGRFTRVAEALPNPEEEGLRHLVGVTARAVAKALDVPRGPIHLNVPFREPLAPTSSERGPIVDPQVPVSTARPLDSTDSEVLRTAVQSARRGLIVCGPRERADGFGEWVHALGQRLLFPVVAEAASNARFGFPHAIGAADAILRVPKLAESLKPDVVLRFGGGLTPKGPQAWLETSGAKIFQFHDDGMAIDPIHRAAGYAFGRPQLEVSTQNPESLMEYVEAWLRAQVAVEGALESMAPEVTEPQVARAVVRSLPAGAALMVSSSMPIRDVDAFASSKNSIRVFANRGLNGIDGITSTALGLSSVAKRPVVLLTGDVALLHDLSAWPIAKRHGLSLVVIVVNNDGGGIFHFLPVADRTAHFEALFGTPHGVDFSAVATLGGASYERVTSIDSLREAVTRGVRGGLHVIEVRTERVANVTAHRALFARLGEVLS